MIDTAALDAPERVVERHGRFWAYSKLVKLAFFDYYLSVLMVWTLLPDGLRTDGRALAVLGLCSVGWLGIVGAAVAFDDITGFRDGSDACNYDPAQALRDRNRKPLLDGHLTVPTAVRWAWLGVAVGAAALGGAVLVAPHRPAWALAAIPFGMLIGLTYSYGLKLSYRGFQELVILCTTGLTVLIPYGLVTGECTGMVALLAVLFGLWCLMVSVYSNLNDAAGDRAAGRRTLAVRLPLAGYRAVIIGLTAAEAVAIGVGAAVGALPWWFALALVPAVLIRVQQVRLGLYRGSPLGARKLGIHALRLDVVTVLAAALVAV